MLDFFFLMFHLSEMSQAFIIQLSYILDPLSQSNYEHFPNPNITEVKWRHFLIIKITFQGV